MTATPQFEQWVCVDPILGRPNILQAHEIPEYQNETYLSYLGDLCRVSSAKSNHVGMAMLVKITDASIEKGDFVIVDRSTYVASLADGVLEGDHGVVMASVPSTTNETEFMVWILIEGHCLAKMAVGVSAGAQLYSDAAIPGTGHGAAGLILDGVFSISAAATADTETAVDAFTVDYEIGYGTVEIRRQ